MHCLTSIYRNNRRLIATKNKTCVIFKKGIFFPHGF